MERPPGVSGELAEIMTSMDDPKASLEELGFDEHDELRLFCQAWGEGAAPGVEARGDELAVSIGTSVAAGFFLGLSYAVAHPELFSRQSDDRNG